MTFGLRQSSGQVKSLFIQDEAVEICQWLKTAYGMEVLRSSSYLFQFPAEIFNEKANRGKNLGFCWQFD
jgi:hypothetical protein